jgi:hypothetical protein
MEGAWGTYGFPTGKAQRTRNLASADVMEGVKRPADATFFNREFRGDLTTAYDGS